MSQCQRTIRLRRNESDVRHSGRLLHKQEYSSRAVGNSSVNLATVSAARAAKRISFAPDVVDNTTAASSSKRQKI